MRTEDIFIIAIGIVCVVGILALGIYNSNANDNEAMNKCIQATQKPLECKESIRGH